MPLIPGQRGHDIGTGIARALQLIGATGRPRMQSGLLASIQEEAERRRLASQYSSLIDRYSQPTGGLLDPAGNISAQTNPPIQSEPMPTKGRPDKGRLPRAYAAGTESGGDYRYKPPGQSAVFGNAAQSYMDGTPKGLLATPEPGMSGGGGGLLSPQAGGQRPMLTLQQAEMLKRLPPEQGYGLLAKRVFAQPAAPEIIEDAAGFKRYATGPQAGQRVFPDVEGKPEKPDMRQDVAGHWRYTTGAQAGQRVFPGIERPTDEKWTAGNVRFPDGGMTTGRRNNTTGEVQYRDRSGGWKPAPFGSTMAGLQLSGTEADADKVRARKFREYEDAASNFMQYGTGLVDAIDTGTPLFGTTGALARFTNSLRAQAEQIGRAFDGEEEAANIVQRMQPGSQTWDRLRQVVGDRADVLGTGIALAYMRAKVLDPVGRISDKDLEASMKSLGFDTNDPSIIRRRIINEMNFLNRSYQSRAKREQIGNTESFNIPARKQEEKRKRLKDKYGLE